MELINTRFDVTLAPAVSVQSHPSNLTGSYGLSVDQCLQRNRIYQSHGSVCQKVISDCVGCGITNVDRQKIDTFCGRNLAGGFYLNGAYWS